MSRHKCLIRFKTRCLLLLLAAALAACDGGDLTDAVGTITAGTPVPAVPALEPAPEFTLTTLDGSTLHLSDLRGQIVVLNFWASWAQPCWNQAPALQAIWETYHSRGVVLVGINYDQTETEARSFIEELGLTYVNGIDAGVLISDQYRVAGVPQTFIIDRDGNIVTDFYGTVTMETIADELDRLLADS